LQPVNDRSLDYPSPRPRISLNRYGSAFVFSPTLSWRWVWRDIWSHHAAGGDIDDAATTIGAIAGLGPREPSTGPRFAELAVRFLDRVGSRGWSWHCAWLDEGGVASLAEPYR
jgi:hypothetical protein